MRRWSIKFSDVSVCADLHRVVRTGTVHRFPFDENPIPLNGIYVIFERGEECHGGDRIVRVGTHTGDGQLRSSLRQHFIKDNKDRSIFRKNIGRALLNRANDPYLNEWNCDRTSRAAKERYGPESDPTKRRAVEAEVTRYLQGHFSFVLFRVEDATERLRLESLLISTISLCADCLPSTTWLGLSSPKERIRETGLWLVNQCYKTPLTVADLEHLRKLLT
jgi:hypothetical protein